MESIVKAGKRSSSHPHRRAHGRRCVVSSRFDLARRGPTTAGPRASAPAPSRRSSRAATSTSWRFMGAAEGPRAVAAGSARARSSSARPSRRWGPNPFHATRTSCWSATPPSAKACPAGAKVSGRATSSSASRAATPSSSSKPGSASTTRADASTSACKVFERIPSCDTDLVERLAPDARDAPETHGAKAPAPPRRLQRAPPPPPNSGNPPPRPTAASAAAPAPSASSSAQQRQCACAVDELLAGASASTPVGLAFTVLCADQSHPHPQAPSAADVAAHQGRSRGARAAMKSARAPTRVPHVRARPSTLGAEGVGEGAIVSR